MVCRGRLYNTSQSQTAIMATFCRILSRTLSIAQKTVSHRPGLLPASFQHFARDFHSSSSLRGTFKFSQNHEYVDITGDRAKLGITEHAQRELGDVVYVELPQVGAELDIADVACSVESVKAVADVYMTITGKVTQVNDSLAGTPELVNSSPLQDGWLIEVEIVKPEQLDDLMDEEAYNNYLNNTE